MSNSYLGEIRMFGFGFAPRNTAFCNGQTISVSQNTALFSLLGVTYGGDGRTTFQLPNLQSRTPVHMGQGSGLSNYALGQIGGSESVTLSVQQMPAHTHAFVSNSSLNVVQIEGATAQASAGSQLARVIDANDTGDALPQIYVPANTAGTNVPLGGLNVAGTNAIQGGNQPHPNIQPYLAINFCINLAGVFPARN